ncbi:IclR family transcriptional regulator [Bosea sp. PAMC 26642]|uniref:IclR family transcriptional regulator n=1 Tax=Bosea sp. (strain PAMC 26642) TaxID=1792307 RepID=UPI0007704452|nr:IclR family transcriptional regulator [Bosea sp. PAMC 26642]AMJ61560.1 hypothetical protein AXW83_15730 [Bosea sp. PAMC 26642]
MSGFSVSSAERCLTILELLSEEANGLTLSEIAARLGLSVSAAHRLLGVLRTKRYVRQDRLNERYLATPLIAVIGLRVLAATGLSDVCQPILDDLAERTGELVRLSIVQEGHLVWIAKAQGSRSNIRYDPLDVRNLPIYATAAGKVWLATLEPGPAIAAVRAQGFPQAGVGPHAATSIEALMTQLEAVRACDFALVRDELEPEISAVAVAIRIVKPPDELIVGCLSVGGPSFRLDKARLTGFVPALRQAAAELAEVWPLRVLDGATPPQRATIAAQ